jgi:hypothetical protein
MSTVMTDVLTELEGDLSWARLELADARFRRRQKDTPRNRLAIAECLDRIDALLDMHLDADPLHR